MFRGGVRRTTSRTANYDYHKRSRRHWSLVTGHSEIHRDPSFRPSESDAILFGMQLFFIVGKRSTPQQEKDDSKTDEKILGNIQQVKYQR
jgi:hypothetical protein